jgi:hypothetical protein
MSLWTRSSSLLTNLCDSSSARLLTHVNTHVEQSFTVIHHLDICPWIVTLVTFVRTQVGTPTPFPLRDVTHPS